MSMVLPTQAYSLTIKPQPAAISVSSFSAKSDISSLYEYRIEFTSPDSDIGMNQVVGRPANFTIEPIDPDAAYLARMYGERAAQFSTMPKAFSTHGVIEAFEKIGTSADETRYSVTLRPKVAELDRARKSRLFQKQNYIEIITDVLRHYGYRLGVDFDFQKLRGKYKRHEYVTQYHETSFNFIRRLCAEEGVWFRLEQKRDRTVIVFGDDLDAYARKGRVIPFRLYSGLESAGAESVRSLRTITQRIPEAIQLNDYNHRQADVSLLVDANAAPSDKTTDGVDSTWGEHYETRDEGKAIARLRHEAHLATQISYRLRGNPFSLEVGEAVNLDVNPKDAPHGLLVTSIRFGGGRRTSYWCSFRAIPADRKWRTSIESISRPKIEGILPARIDSPGKYTYGYVTEKGLYVTTMPFDLDEWSPGGRSRAIRMMRPYAGQNYGHHFPLIDGTEVALIFTNQDPNRPVIAGSLHDSLNPDLVNNLNHTRNIIRSAAQNELRMEDKRGYPWMMLTASRLIVKHESEWANPEKWKQLYTEIEQVAGPKPQYVKEQERIEKLVWWDEVKAKVPGFPGPSVFHIHPIGLVGNFVTSSVCACGCCYSSSFKVTRMGSTYGPIYWGSRRLSSASVLEDMVASGELTLSEKQILVAMSENEGKLDSVQSYDSEILTAGAMQKTINPQGKGEFPTQVALFKSTNPNDYVDLFEQCGWSVEGTGTSAVMYYTHATLTQNSKITGTALKELIRRDCSAEKFNKVVENIPLGSIVNAITSKMFEKRQIMDFIDRLRDVVLPRNPGNYNHPISEYFLSDLGRAVALDQSVNRPAYVAPDVGASLDRFFARHPAVSRDPSGWGSNHASYEAEIVQDYGNSRRMARVNGVSVAPARFAHLRSLLN